MTTSKTEPSQDFAFTEYQQFVRTRPEEMEQYLTNKIPLPDASERFNWEDYEDNSPILLEMQSWGSSMRSLLTNNCIMIVVITVIMGIVLVLCGVEETFGDVAIGAVLLIAATAAGGWFGLSNYKINLELAESDTFRDAVFGQHLPKWAVARYDFNYEEDFLAMLKGKDGMRCYLAEGGSQSGLVVSSATGEEWPLKPGAEKIS